MNKTVLMIDGSARRRNTYGVLRQIEQILHTQDIQTEIVNLFDFHINDCIGCEACVRGKNCAFTDDMVVLKQKILESDGVILCSPVYMCSVSSRFKTFADRLNAWIHKPEAAGKPMMFVTTTAATGLKETQKFFNSWAAGLGARNGSFIARTEKRLSYPVRENELSRFLALLGGDAMSYKPSMNEIVLFNVGKVLALKSNGDDRAFWENKGWLDKKFYYSCKMNLFKTAFSGFMLKVLSKAMK